MLRLRTSSTNPLTKNVRWLRIKVYQIKKKILALVYVDYFPSKLSKILI